jgi:hypothetical protein
MERVQLGVRMEKRLVKVLKAMSEYHDITLGTLLEGIVLYAFEGKSPFDDETIGHINRLKEIYGMDYDTTSSHLLHLAEQEQDDEI